MLRLCRSPQVLIVSSSTGSNLILMALQTSYCRLPSSPVRVCIWLIVFGDEHIHRVEVGSPKKCFPKNGRGSFFKTRKADCSKFSDSWCQPWECPSLEFGEPC